MCERSKMTNIVVFTVSMAMPYTSLLNKQTVRAELYRIVFCILLVNELIIYALV